MYVSEPKIYETVNKYSKDVINKERFFVTGGHYLDFPEGYTDQAVLRPKPLGTNIVWLKMDCLNRDVKGERIR
jgi:hypothetical protein